jgi:hypothetical protein
MKLTNYRKFMVEKYYSFVPKISEEEFCTNHSRTKLKIEDFKEWISLYNDSNNKPIKTEPKLSKNKLEKQIEPKQNIEDRKTRRNRKTHLRQIRYYKSVVKTGKFTFSKDITKHSSRIKLFLNSENTFTIYRLALILAEDLNDCEHKVDLLLNELKKNKINIPDDFFKFQFTNKTSLPLEHIIEESTIELAPVVFEIDPSKNNKLISKREVPGTEELNSLCETSISNLQKSLAGVYKILEGLK